MKIEKIAEEEIVKAAVANFYNTILESGNDPNAITFTATGQIVLHLRDGSILIWDKKTIKPDTSIEEIQPPSNE